MKSMYIVYSLARGSITHTVDVAMTGSPVRAGNNAITMHWSFATLEDARVYQAQLQTAFGCTASPVRPSNARCEVECVNDGMLYRSIREAATAAGVSSTALWLHLNEPAKYPTVRGKTYRKA